MLSIVIPVYNTEIFYVERCIEHIMNQPYSNFEIVVVNDGSKKEYTNNLESLVSKNGKIKYIYQENKGVSAARNTGIRNANGEFLAFVDADDIISETFISKGMELMREYNLDLVIGSIKYEPNIYNLGIQGPEQFTVYSGKEIQSLKRSLLGMRVERIKDNILGSPCGRIYRKSCVNSIFFEPEVRICEDQLYNLYALDCCERVGIIPQYWYTYYQNEFSALHSISNGLSFYPFYKKLYEYNKMENELEIKNFIYDKIVGHYSGLCRLITKEQDLSFSEKIQKIKSYRKEELFKNAISEIQFFDTNISFSHRIRAVFLKMHLDIILVMYHCFVKK